jgi:hypothetical protein
LQVKTLLGEVRQGFHVTGMVLNLGGILAEGVGGVRRVHPDVTSPSLLPALSTLRSAHVH